MPEKKLTPKEAIEAKIREMQRKLQRMNAAENEARRKAETRAKIIIGGLVLSHQRDSIAGLLSHASERDAKFLKDFLNPNPQQQ